MSALLAVLRRDLTLALRQGGGFGMALGFFLTVMVLIPLAVGPDLALLQRIAPGLLWITMLLSVLLSADRIYQADYDDGSLELMTVAPMPLELTVVAKSLAHWLASGLPMAIAAPALGLLLNLDSAVVPSLMLAMVTGSLALSLIASLAAAVVVGLRRGGLLLSLLALPLYVPVMIFGISASTPDPLAPATSSHALLILVAIVLVTLVVTPIAGAAAIRAHLR
ncbi:MAG: heme exporter protein CcmB [Hyphomicrobiales bacterium]